MKKRKICIVTGTRAEYGMMYWLIRSIEQNPKLELQIIVTGMHLSNEFGLTYKEIEKDGFSINYKVEMLLSSDTPSAISKSTGMGLIGFADAFNKLDPDVVVVVGDRFESFSASIAALYARIPIAHIHGGETTLGAFDEAIRHSITKIAWWHFVAADEYYNRVVQLGENPNRVFKVGGLGVDAIKKMNFLSQKKLMNKTGINFGKKNLLITFHPVTLEKKTSEKNFQHLLDALQELNEYYLIFTMPNADSDGRVIKHMINKFVLKHSQRSISFTSMGRLNYLSTLQFVNAVVGNSSSGLTEAPTFRIGTINIGDRQEGRLKAKSIIDCEPTKGSIIKAIKYLDNREFIKRLPTVVNPYGHGDAVKKIEKILVQTKLPDSPKKQFYDL